MNAFQKTILLSVIFLAACSPQSKPVVTGETAGKTPVKTLYHDNTSGLDYDYKAACQFRSTLNTLLTKQEWNAIHSGKFRKQTVINDPSGQFVMYTYAHKGAEVDYSNSSQFEVWRMHFDVKRLPKSMRSKKYFLSRFNIHNAPASAKVLSLECEATKITINFKKDKTADLTFQLLLAAI